MLSRKSFSSGDGNPVSSASCCCLPHSPKRAPPPPPIEETLRFKRTDAAIMTNINPQALYTACLNGDAAAVSRLLPLGGTPRNLSGPRFQPPDDNSTPLMACCRVG